MIEPPVPLAGEARKYWDRHAERLHEGGILTDADLESFVQLCWTWANLVKLSIVEPGPDAYREMIQVTNLNKQFQNLAKKFGLTPADRKQSKLGEAKKKTPNKFGLGG